MLVLVSHTIDELTVDFTWGRNRLFDRNCVEALLMVCQLDPTVHITNVTQKPKSKWRPQALDTIELEKLGSRKLKISAKETMTIAEKLYTQGFISYPRTETNIFSKEINLRYLLYIQCEWMWSVFRPIYINTSHIIQRARGNAITASGLG